MSFSAEVRGELAAIVPDSRHCRIAEIAALTELLGVREDGRRDGDPAALVLRTDRGELTDLLFTLFQRTFNIVLDVRGNGKQILSVRDRVEAGAVRAAVSHGSLLRAECCQRSWLRGAFLAAGSVSAPEKAYHLEITAGDAAVAGKIADVMRRQGMKPRTAERKGETIVYLKEADQIVMLLGIMGGSNSCLALESARVVKDVRGRINRSVNCETANLDRTISSAVRQAEDIRLIIREKGLDYLNPSLREIAELRLEYPEASFAELGTYADPKIGKSGVHHRLRKISAIAEDLRQTNADSRPS